MQLLFASSSKILLPVIISLTSFLKNVTSFTVSEDILLNSGYYKSKWIIQKVLGRERRWYLNKQNSTYFFQWLLIR